MHAINYIKAPRNVNKKQLLNQINDEVIKEGDGGDYLSYGKLKDEKHWHENRIYRNEEEARKAINGYDNGWYDDHAVLFYDTESVEPSAKAKSIIQRIHGLQQKLEAFYKDSDVHNRKSDSITCRNCKSRIMLAYFRGRFRCPVCGEDMRSESVLKRDAKLRADIDRAQRELVNERDSHAGKAPVMWLVKYEYHC